MTALQCKRCASTHVLDYSDHGGGPGYACVECGYVSHGSADYPRWGASGSDSDDQEAELQALVAAERLRARQAWADEMARWLEDSGHHAQ